MLSTLSINANGEVVGGSAKFKMISSSTAPSAGVEIGDLSADSVQQEELLRKAALVEDASSSYNEIYIDVLKGDLQRLEARYHLSASFPIFV